MKIEEAIQILTDDLEQEEYFLPQQFKDALKLGIEAQHVILKGRKHQDPYYATLLPSETTD